jgi:RNA polymerase sporulation-specific sigma factor
MFSFLSFLLETLLLVGSLKKSGSFPQPLSKEEEAEWTAKLGTDEEAREKLVLHNMRLVAHIAKKYAKPGRDIDDLISIGTIGLIKAVSTFNLGRGNLSNYISKCVENEILMSLRTERKKAGEVSMYEPIGTDREGNSLSLMDLIGSDSEDIFETVNRRMNSDLLIAAMRKSLSEREQTVLELRFGVGGSFPMPQREVSELLGISRSYVSRIEKRALEKLRNEMKD